jgi:hypothetical protein
MMKRRTAKRRSTVPPGSKPVARPRRSRAERELAKHLLAVLKTGGDVRVAKIKRIRQSVRTRTYENELKLTVALDRLNVDLTNSV